MVWAAGVKAPDVLKELDGLETNRINQLIVLPTLQTTRDANIFAFGDCAACPWIGTEGRRATARAGRAPAGLASVQAIKRRLAGQALTEWRYRDFGSLVSLGEYSTVGNLMGGAVCGSKVCSPASCTALSTRCTSTRCMGSDESDARYCGAADYPAYRAARETALRAQ